MIMAYVAFAENGAVGGVAPLLRKPAMVVDPPRFSALEWSVIALARRDRLSSLRTPGRMAIALGRLFGERHNPRLADPALEALRRMAVLTWHYGYSVASDEVRAFVEAGFTTDQYELMVMSVAAGRRDAQGKRFQR